MVRAGTLKNSVGTDEERAKLQERAQDIDADLLKEFFPEVKSSKIQKQEPSDTTNKPARPEWQEKYTDQDCRNSICEMSALFKKQWGGTDDSEDGEVSLATKVKVVEKRMDIMEGRLVELDESLASIVDKLNQIMDKNCKTLYLHQSRTHSPMQSANAYIKPSLKCYIH